MRRNEQSFWTKLFTRVILYSCIGFLLTTNHQQAKEHERNIQRFHRHIIETKLPYVPQKLDKYIKVLSDEFYQDMSFLKQTPFYVLDYNSLKIACDFHKDAPWVIFGCYHPYINVIFVSEYEHNSCDTELHELIHAAIDATDPFGSLTGVLNSMHKHELFTQGKIENLCNSNTL